MLQRFLAHLFEWFGLIPFYSKDLSEYLKGRDFTCSDYLGTPWYEYFALIMIGLTGVMYVLQYYIIDSSVYNKREHWWFVAFVNAFVNFLVSATILYYTVDQTIYCAQLTITTSDCLGFALSDAIWSVVVYALISSIPVIRRFSRHSKYTTFWTPK